MPEDLAEEYYQIHGPDELRGGANKVLKVAAALTGHKDTEWHRVN